MKIKTGAAILDIRQSKQLNLEGDSSGNKSQRGGALVVEAGGEPIYKFKQEYTHSHVENHILLKVFYVGIDLIHATVS